MIDMFGVPIVAHPTLTGDPTMDHIIGTIQIIGGVILFVGAVYGLWRSRDR